MIQVHCCRDSEGFEKYLYSRRQIVENLPRIRQMFSASFMKNLFVMLLSVFQRNDLYFIFGFSEYFPTPFRNFSNKFVLVIQYSSH